MIAPPRDFSQRTTSFIASQRQGIHQTPFWHLIALIAKTRFGERRSANSDWKRLRSRSPIVRSPIAAPWREKTSFASNASGSPSGQQRTHDWLLVRKQTTDHRGRIVPRLLIRIPATGCASSSRCQRSDDGRRTTEDRCPRPASSAPCGKGASKRLPTKLILHRMFELGRPKPLLSSVVRPLFIWWSQTGSNRRPNACKARALQTELWPRQKTADRGQTTEKRNLLASVIWSLSSEPGGPGRT